MTETRKQIQPKADAKAEEPKKTETALDEKQLDQVTGGGLSKSCVTGKHFQNAILTTH
jgi:hypothetical protein